MVRNFSREIPSVALNLPQESGFGKDYVFAEINSTEYTIENMESFLKKIPNTHACTIYSRYKMFSRIPSVKVF
jgi:hypothetical protein